MSDSDDIPIEPSAETVEWDAIFRQSRIKARELMAGASDAHDFAVLVEAIETLASIDPSYAAHFQGDPVDDEGDGEAAAEGDKGAAPPPEAGDEDDDEDDTDTEIKVSTK